MKILHLALAALATIALTTIASAADNKKLLVGKWEAVKVDEGTLPKGATVEFKADGKMVTTAKKGDKEETNDGIYTVDGDSFTISMKREGKEHSMKIMIKKLTETEMEATNPEGKSVTFKKVK